VTLDGTIADDDLDDMIQDSYDLVAAKLTRARREKIGFTRPSAKRTNSS
jgi:predicted DNA-binding protein (MmcQ/YjbR family)